MNNLTEEQLVMARDTVLTTLKYEKITLNDHELDLLIDDLYNLIIEAGGDFTKNNLRFYLLEYIRNDFLHRFRMIHEND